MPRGGSGFAAMTLWLRRDAAGQPWRLEGSTPKAAVVATYSPDLSPKEAVDAATKAYPTTRIRMRSWEVGF